MLGRLGTEVAELTRSYLCPSLGQKSFFSKLNTYIFHDAPFEKTLILLFTVILSRHSLQTIKQEPIHLKLDFKHLFAEFRGEKKHTGNAAIYSQCLKV